VDRSIEKEAAARTDLSVESARPNRDPQIKGPTVPRHFCSAWWGFASPANRELKPSSVVLKDVDFVSQINRQQLTKLTTNCLKAY